MDSKINTDEDRAVRYNPAGRGHMKILIGYCGIYRMKVWWHVGECIQIPAANITCVTGARNLDAVLAICRRNFRNFASV